MIVGYAANDFLVAVMSSCLVVHIGYVIKWYRSDRQLLGDECCLVAHGSLMRKDCLVLTDFFATHYSAMYCW